VLLGLANDSLFVSGQGHKSGYPLGCLERVDIQYKRGGDFLTALLSAGVALLIFLPVIGLIASY